MAEEKKGNAAKEFLLKHGEKLALGAALTLLALYVLVFKPQEDPNIRSSENAIKNVKEQGQTPKDKDLPPAAKPWEQAATTPWNTTIMARAGGDAWAATLYSDFEEKIRPKPKIVKKPVLAPSVDFGTIEVDLSHVTLSWTVKEFTKIEKQKGSKENDYTDLTGFKIERQKSGGAWEVLAEKLGPAERSFKDTKIDPKTAYNYRISAYADTKEYKERGGPDATERPDGLVALVTAPAPAQTLGIWKLTFLNPFKPENAEKGQVYVKIEKYEKPLGSKVEKARIHRAGDVIGWWEESGNPEPTPRHRVQVGTKSVEVDFDTKISLVSVEPRKAVIEIKKCTPKFTGGQRDGCNTVTEKRTFDVHEIVLKGPDGDERILSPNPRENPNGQDQFCEEHGGRRPGAAPGGPKPDAPQEDPAVVAARKREAEAEKLFKDAEKLVATNKGPQAAVIYEKLLKDYGATEFVSKNARAVIEDRLRNLQK